MLHLGVRGLAELVLVRVCSDVSLVEGLGSRCCVVRGVQGLGMFAVKLASVAGSVRREM